MAIGDELQKLNELRQNGALSDEEFQRAKQTLLDPQGPAGRQQGGGTLAHWSSDINTWSMFIHLSQLCGFVIPVAGLVVPIVLWQIKKNESWIIDRHGRIVANWMISALIYALICVVLYFVIIGVFLLMALGVCCILFAIIGGIKAQNGEFWPYPMSINFFPIN